MRHGANFGEAAAKRREETGATVRLRELSRARLALTSAGLAPGNEATLQELTNEELRPQELSELLPSVKIILSLASMFLVSIPTFHL